jgi:hypothetical protein
MVKFRDLFDEPRPREQDDHDDQGRDRPDWRELDRKRDQSRHVIVDPKPHPSPRAFRDKRQENKAKQALDQFFQGKKSKEQETAWKKVIEVAGRSFSLRASNYVEKFGLPRIWDDLLRLLDHDHEEFVGKILDRMVELAPKETAIRRDLLVGKLRVLKMEREEPALLKKFEDTLAALEGM